MRINRFIALATGMSRRAADTAIAEHRVYINSTLATPGVYVVDTDSVVLDGNPITPSVKTQTIMLHKPVGYVCSRDGQGSSTVYDLLPGDLHHLKPVGRLDKSSSGLLLLTNNGKLAHELTHPSSQKVKIYEVRLDKTLRPQDKLVIEQGIELEDGISKLALQPNPDKTWTIRMHEGRNRQIRRTFQALGYTVRRLHRSSFGEYSLNDLATGKYEQVSEL